METSGGRRICVCQNKHLTLKLRPYIEKQSTRMRSPVGVDKRVAVTLWRLATNIEYRTLSQLFGISVVLQ